MADYKMVNATKLDAAMTATANKIRAGTGKSDKITWKEDNGFADDIPEGVEQATPTIDVGDDGKITASSTQGGGIVKSGTHAATKQLELQAAMTVTPSTHDQTVVNKGRYTTGDIIVKGDEDLIPKNIKKGVEIFDVIGTAEEGKPVEIGSFTPASDVLEVTISHNLGVLPSLALFFIQGGFDSLPFKYTALGIYVRNYNFNDVWANYGAGGLSNGSYWAVYNSSETSITFHAAGFENLFKAGKEYKYILVG